MNVNTKWLIIGILLVLKERCKAAIQTAPNVNRISKGTRVGGFVFEVEIDRVGMAFIPKVTYVGSVENSALPAHITDLADKEKSTAIVNATVKDPSCSVSSAEFISLVTTDLNNLAAFAQHVWSSVERDAQQRGFIMNYNTQNVAKSVTPAQSGDKYMVYGSYDVSSWRTGIMMSVRQNPNNLNMKYISADMDVTVSREIKGDEEFSL